MRFEQGTHIVMTGGADDDYYIQGLYSVRQPFEREEAYQNFIRRFSAQKERFAFDVDRFVDWLTEAGYLGEVRYVECNTDNFYLRHDEEEHDAF